MPVDDKILHKKILVFDFEKHTDTELYENQAYRHIFPPDMENKFVNNIDPAIMLKCEIWVPCRIEDFMKLMMFK